MNNLDKERNEYASLLEMYARMLRRPNYQLTEQQKEIMKKLGKTFLRRSANIPKRLVAMKQKRASRYEEKEK